MSESKAARFKTHLSILGVAAFLLIVQAALLPQGAVWITDNGNKYIVLENLARRLSPTVEYHGVRLDPEHRFFPDGNFHFRMHDGKIRSIYPEFFSALALPGYMVFDQAGLWILPIGGTLAVLAIFLALLSRLGLPTELKTGLAGLLLCGTPLLFYSGTFWEMTLATVFPLAALVAARQKRLLLAGLWLGAGLWLREEFYLIALAAGIAALVFYPKMWRRCIPFGAGFLALALPLWLYNFSIYGHILGFHGALYYSHNVESVPTVLERIIGLFEGYFIYLFKFDSGYPNTNWYDWIALLPMFLLPITGFLREARRFKVAIAWAAVGAWAFLLWRFWTNPFPVFASGVTVGLISSSPLLAGFFLYWRNLLCRGPRPRRMLTLAALLYCLALPLVLTRSDIGIIWGARHYLLILPILLLLSFLGVLRLGWLRTQKTLLAALILAALTLQTLGIRSLFGVAEDVARIEAVFTELRPRIIVTDLFFLPEQTPRLYYGCSATLLYLKSDQQVDELIALLRQQGEQEFLLVLSALPNFRQLSDAGLTRLLQEAPPISPPVRLNAPGSGFMELLITKCRLQ